MPFEEVLLLLNRDERHLLYFTQRNLGKVGQKITPKQGDLSTEKFGAALSFRPNNNDYILSTASGDQIIKEPLASVATFAAKNRFLTVVEQNPRSAEEIILWVQENKPKTDQQQFFITLSSWLLVLTGVVFLYMTALRQK